MITDIHVICRGAAKHILENNYPHIDNYWALLSINSPDSAYLLDEVSLHSKQRKYTNSLSIKFSDIIPKDQALAIKYSFDKPIELFNEKHAKDIIQFIDKLHAHRHNIDLYIHCDAGISRSGAVGVFACNYLHLDLAYFLVRHKQIYPNIYILNVLDKVARIHSRTIATVRLNYSIKFT